MFADARLIVIWLWSKPLNNFIAYHHYNHFPKQSALRGHIREGSLDLWVSCCYIKYGTRERLILRTLILILIISLMTPLSADFLFLPVFKALWANASCSIKLRYCALHWLTSVSSLWLVIWSVFYLYKLNSLIQTHLFILVWSGIYWIADSDSFLNIFVSFVCWCYS